MQLLRQKSQELPLVRFSITEEMSDFMLLCPSVCHIMWSVSVHFNRIYELSACVLLPSKHRLHILKKDTVYVVHIGL